MLFVREGSQPKGQGRSASGLMDVLTSNIEMGVARWLDLDFAGAFVLTRL